MAHIELSERDISFISHRSTLPFCPRENVSKGGYRGYIGIMENRIETTI